MDIKNQEKKVEDFEDFDGIDPEKLVTEITSPVLIIDDDKMIQAVLEKHLNSWGFRAISTSDPYDGVALAVRHRPVFILLDVYLPDLNGEKLLKLIKKIDLTSRIPVIIISGNLSMDLLNNTYSNGASGFLSKPFTREDLYNSIKNVLSPSAFHKMVNEGFKMMDDKFDHEKSEA